MRNSLRRIFTIAQNTYIHLTRLKIFYFLIIFTVLIFIIGFLFLRFSVETKLKMLKDVSFAAMSTFTWIFAIAASSSLIPTELEDRTLYTTLAKPLPRGEYLLGKYLGIISLLASILVIMAVCAFLLLGFQQKAFTNSTRESMELANMSKDAIEARLEIIRNQGYDNRLWGGIFTIFLKSSVISIYVMLISTFSSSHMFALLIGFVAFFIGHGIALARDYWLSSGILPDNLAQVVSVFLVTLFPDLKRFDCVDRLIVGDWLSLGNYAYLGGLALIYIAFYYALSGIIFANKEL